MNTNEADSRPLFLVVLNLEEQYSIWPENREIPAGWKPVGPPRSREDCLAFIKEVWTDMRPLSLRNKGSA